MKNATDKAQSKDIAVVADGGASGSRFAIFDSTGARVAETQGPPASLSLGTTATCEAIKTGIRQLGEQFFDNPQWCPEHIMLGLAGAEQLQQKQQFQQRLEPLVTCDIVTDGYAHLMGVSAGRPAICLSLGTGSVVHWHDGKTQGFGGGWGFPVGDEASGAWLGRALVNAWLWSIDTDLNNGAHGDCPSATETKSPSEPQPTNRTFPGPSLIAGLEERIGRTRSDIQHWTISAVSTDYASLVDLLLTADAAGDNFAAILKASGLEACLRLLGLCPQHLPVYIAGGLAPFYQSELQQQLGGRIKTAEGDALDGLRLLAISLPS